MREIAVQYFVEPEGAWATSDDLEGLAVAGRSLAEVRQLVREAVGVYLDGETVDLREVLPQDNYMSPLTLVSSSTVLPMSVWSRSDNEAAPIEQSGPRSITVQRPILSMAQA